MSELHKILREAAADVKPGEHKCRYCGQGFVKETTLAVHQCEPKRRAMQKNEKGVQIGFQAWLRFYEITQGSAKTKTSDDFCNSQFYNAFVKFGRHCVSINAINVTKFIDHVIRKQIKVDRWCQDRVYDDYLYELLRAEASQDSLERGIETMVDWAETENAEFHDYFRKISAGRLIMHLQNGRISPWVIYNCMSGVDALEAFTDEQVALVIRWIDPEYWQRRFRDFMADTELTKHVLEQAGL